MITRGARATWKYSCIALLLAVCGGARAERVAVRDLNGSLVMPLEIRNRKATVFVFITNDCPIANSYAPELERIYAAYTPKQVGFYLVYVDPSLSATVAKQHAKAYGYTCPALLDPRHRLVQLTGARVTPEAAVVAPDGKVLYHGRIDDRVSGFGQARVQPTTHDLRNALDAVLQKKPVPHPVTSAIGCYISDMSAGLKR